MPIHQQALKGTSLISSRLRTFQKERRSGKPTKDKQEVINYLKALDSMPKYAKKEKIDIPLFLEIHNTITTNTLRSDLDCGVFRDRQVFVGRRIFDGTGFKEIVEYMPPDTKDVPGLVRDFLDWLNSEEAKKVNPVILAGIIHYEVARIHPFIDGNGRTARLMASLIFYTSGFDHRRFFALDDYYDEDKFHIRRAKDSPARQRRHYKMA